MYVLAVFRSRTQTLEFCSRMKALGLSVSAVNTPREANVGCGLSAKLDCALLGRARMVLRGGKYTAFAGFFKVENKYGKVFVTRL